MAATLGTPAAAQADDFTVTTGGDGGDLMCDVTCTLRDALDDSNANNNGPGIVDRILFAGTVTGTINVLGTEFPEIDESLEIVGPGASTLTVNGGPTFRALSIDAAGGTVVSVSGLTLTGHRDNDGGGVYSYDADLTLDGVTVTASGTTGPGDTGGGVYSFGGDLKILNSTVSGNTTTGVGALGGGVYLTNGGLEIENSTITGNSTSGASSPGGGIYATTATGDDLSIFDTTISGNSTTDTAGDGGGIFAQTTGELTVIRSTISGNFTTGSSGDGGGLSRTPP